MVETVEAGRTPLQENLDRLGGTLAKAALVVVALVVAIGLARGLPALEMFMFGIALAVAVVPEALPAVVTISLAIGVRRMVKRNALVRRLPIVETLGSTSVICSDKTGTLTKNEMTVRRLFADDRVLDLSGTGYDPEGGVWTTAVRSTCRPVSRSAARSDARLGCPPHRAQRPPSHRGRSHRGRPRGRGHQGGIETGRPEREEPRVAEIPFTSERRRMTTLHTTAAGSIAYSKGAADDMVPSCTSLFSHGREVALTDVGPPPGGRRSD